jgi:predicted AAA+ superfamily ATPase
LPNIKNADIELDDMSPYIFSGFLPRVYDQQQRPHTAYSSYFQTHIERDVRQLIKLKDVVLFEKFMKLLADCPQKL